MISYNLEGPRWATPVVTWRFAPTADATFTNPIGAPFQESVRAAAAAWNAVSRVTLQEVAPGAADADITIGWGAIAGPQIGKTDYSYQLGVTATFLPGVTIRIEDPALLPLAAGPGALFQGTATTLLEMAEHEFGHALGLGLSNDPNAVMNLRLGFGNATLDASDRAGIEALYGVQAAADIAPLPGTIPIGPDRVGVYRFFDTVHGTEFLTGSVGEADAIIGAEPSLAYEGLAMAGIAPAVHDPDAVPVYRFFDTSTGTHFFTANAAEQAALAATRPDLVPEQTSFLEHAAPEPGDAPVYRFFDERDGTHFFTASESERAALAANRPDMAFEGVAFYAPSVG